MTTAFSGGSSEGEENSSQDSSLFLSTQILLHVCIRWNGYLSRLKSNSMLFSIAVFANLPKVWQKLTCILIYECNNNNINLKNTNNRFRLSSNPTSHLFTIIVLISPSAPWGGGQVEQRVERIENR